MAIRSVAMSVAIAVSATTTTVNAQVPHTFSSGQPARANEVNENFEALDQRIEALESILAAMTPAVTDNLILQDANGAEVGKVIAIDEFDPGALVRDVYVPVALPGGSGDDITLISQFHVDNVAGSSSLFYVSANCAGTPHLRWYRETTFAFPLPNLGFVETPAQIDRGSGDIYVANGPVQTDRSLFSSWRFWNGSEYVCNSYDQTGADVFYPALITGNFFLLHPPPYTLNKQ